MGKGDQDLLLPKIVCHISGPLSPFPLSPLDQIDHTKMLAVRSKGMVIKSVKGP